MRCRSTRSAAAEVEAPAALRARIERQQRAAPRRRRAALCPRRRRRAVRGGGRRCRAVAAPARSAEQLPRGARTHRARARRRRRSHAHQDVLGLADRAERHGTAPRRDGLFYEAWLQNAAGVLVPIGTFNEGRKVTLWAGVSPKDYPSLTVTREQADGNQASSGEKVLVGLVTSGR